MKFNLGIDVQPHKVQINAQSTTSKVLKLEQLLKEFKDVFAWTYKDMKGIPLGLAQHRIELDSIIPLAHQARYRINPKYIIGIK
jgi:hypothetical protein